MTLKIPAGTKSGVTFRVKGRGVATSKGLGDLLVTVEIVVQTQLTELEVKAIEALAEVADWEPRNFENGER